VGRLEHFKTIFFFIGLCFFFDQPAGETSESMLPHDGSEDAKSRMCLLGVIKIKINISNPFYTPKMSKRDKKWTVEKLFDPKSVNNVDAQCSPVNYPQS